MVAHAGCDKFFANVLFFVFSRQRAASQQVLVPGMHSAVLVGSGTSMVATESNMADTGAIIFSSSDGRVFTTANSNLVHIPGPPTPENVSKLQLAR